MNNKLKLGVDIGGTDIKFGIVKETTIIKKYDVPTLYKGNTEQLISYIADECKKIMNEYSISNIGIGVPGVVNNNVVRAPVNLPFRNTPLGEILSKKLNMHVFVENDANCAALGELAVNDDNINNLVMLTIGTGIGSGIIINREIYQGKGRGGEIGHSIIKIGGRHCKCGQKGCVEQYISTTALISTAIKEMKKNKESLLYSIYKRNNNYLDGKLFFEALDKNCCVAQKVFAEYVDYFIGTIKSVNNILNPDIIVLSGGITKVGDKLLTPIKEKIGIDINIKISTLQNDAGIIGATNLCH